MKKKNKRNKKCIVDLETIVVVCTADTYVCNKPGLLKVFAWDQKNWHANNPGPPTVKKQKGYWLLYYYNKTFKIRFKVYLGSLFWYLAGFQKSYALHKIIQKTLAFFSFFHLEIILGPHLELCKPQERSFTPLWGSVL